MAHKNNFVSIIIPVYNAEESLYNCIESILDQTYQNIELIIVNDGSTDQSGDICDFYASLDKRIHVIHQKNAGPSSARNKGIQYATGRYLQFVDADDYIQPTMTDELVHAMTNNIQLVICGYQSIHSQVVEKYIPTLKGTYEQADLMHFIGELYKDILLPSPCNKLYDAALIKHYQLHFQEEIHMGEDLLFNLAYIKHCTAIHIIDDLLYNYVIQNNQSLSRGFDKDFFTNQQILHEQVKEFLVEEDYYVGENKENIYIIYINSIINSFNNLFHQKSKLTTKEKKEQIKKIVTSVRLEQDVSYKESIQAKLVEQMIKNKSVLQIYILFTIKRILQMRLSPIYYFLKRRFGH